MGGGSGTCCFMGYRERERDGMVVASSLSSLGHTAFLKKKKIQFCPAVCCERIHRPSGFSKEKNCPITVEVPHSLMTSS